MPMIFWKHKNYACIILHMYYHKSRVTKLRQMYCTNKTQGWLYTGEINCTYRVEGHRPVTGQSDVSTV